MFTMESTIPEKGKGSKLTDKMSLFVDEYLLDLNASQACIRAGYVTRSPHKMGHKLLNHPLVKQAIEERKDARREKLELTAEYVISKLVAIVEKTEDDSPQAALRGLELLGKHLGLYRDRQEISGPDGEAIHIREEETRQTAEEFKSKIASLSRRSNLKAVEDETE